MHTQCCAMRNLCSIRNSHSFRFKELYAGTYICVCIIIEVKLMLVVLFQQLDEKSSDALGNEALRQVALADILIINKIDLVPEDHLDVISKRIR